MEMAQVHFVCTVCTSQHRNCPQASMMHYTFPSLAAERMSMGCQGFSRQRSLHRQCAATASGRAVAGTLEVELKNSA